jgi:transcriptional regulator with XRE-family HTH domain
MPKRRDIAPPKELTTLATRLKYARERAGLTATAVAARADLDLSQVSRYEKGERVEGIEAATVIRLARALGVPVGWLAADEGTLPPIPVFEEGSDRRRRPKAHGK